MSGSRSKPTTSIIGHKQEVEKLVFWLQHDITELPEEQRERHELKPYQKEKLNRVLTTQSLMFEHKSVRKVVQMHKKTFGLSDATAYRDIRLVNAIFGDLNRVSKDLRRALAEEMIMEDRKRAIERKDTKSLPASTRNYIQLYGLDKEDAEIPDLSDFEWRMNIIAVLPEQVGVNPVDDETILETQFKDIMELNAEDVDFEELEK